MPEPKFNREYYKKNQEGESGSFVADLTGHLDEMRNCIIVIVLTLLVLVLVSFYFSGELIKLLQQTAPPGSSFFQLKPGELFFTSLKVSVYSSIFAGLPVITQQLGRFIQPGLTDKEKKTIQPILFFLPILFWSGVYFAYSFLLPPLLKFLLNFREDIIETRYGLEHFVNLVLAIMTTTGLCFLLPILLIVLGMLGIFSSKQMLSIWRYVVLFSFVLAAIITPTPDPLTMSILASALLTLYFSTILILKILKK